MPSQFPKILQAIPSVLLILGSVLLTLLAQQIPFFWDNVLLVSKIATFYYENGLDQVILPNKIDVGHPPFYGYYMAIWWKCLGRSLWVSHLAVLPFMLLGGWAYLQIARSILPTHLLPFALLLWFLEPCLLAQQVLGGQDIALVAGFLWSLSGLMHHRKVQGVLGMLIMVGISNRGMLMIIGLGLALFFFPSKNRKASWIRYYFLRLGQLYPYLLPIVFLIFWHGYHYQQTGFILWNNTTSFATTYGFVSFKGFCWNFAVVVWRFLDNGRIIVYLLLGGLWIKQFIHKDFRSSFCFNINVSDHHLQKLIWYTTWSFICFLPFTILRATPILHRYFLVYFLILTLILLALNKERISRLAKLVVISVLLSGHFWIYPYPIANGWDAHLGFLPYFELRHQINDYLEGENVDWSRVGGEFPMVNKGYFTHLNQDKRYFEDKDLIVWEELEYMVYSNICNDFSLEEKRELEQLWELIEVKQLGLVEMKIYRRK